MIKAKKVGAALTLLLLMILALGVNLLADKEPDTAVNLSDTADFVLVLDCTNSMSDAGTAELCEAAAKLFADLLPSNNVRISVVAFGNTWNQSYTFESDELSYMNDVMGEYARTRVCLSYDMTTLSDSDARAELKEAISARFGEPRYTRTNAYVGGGLMTALDMLCEYGSTDAAVVLVSDGRLSGFDTTDGVEWKRTNRELVSDAVDFAAKKGWKLYAVELNADGRNTPGSAAKQLFSELTSKTGAISREVTANDFGQLADSFADIFADFMESKSESYTKRLDGGSCTLELTIPEILSEYNIIISGEITAVNAGGRSYTTDYSGENACFVKNQDGEYSLLKLFSPEAGTLRVTIKGKAGAEIGVRTEALQNLPVGIELGNGSSVVRNSLVDIRAFLANHVSGEAVSAPDFYKNAEVELKVDSELVEVETSDEGWSGAYEFKKPGEYEISVEIVSDSLRGGSASFSREIKVADYGFEVFAEGHDDKLSRGEILTLRAYFTGPDGRITDDSLYREGDALLTVYRGGSKLESGLAMKPDGQAGGYFCEYIPEETGSYSFEVTTSAECLGGSPKSLTGQSGELSCGDYSVSVEWSADERGLSGVAELAKSSVVKVSALLLGEDGNQILKSRLLSDGEAELVVEVGGRVFETIPMKTTDGILSGEWRVRRAGEIELILKVGGEEVSEVSFTVENHPPVLIKDSAEVICSVGETIALPLGEYISDKDGDIFTLTVAYDSNRIGELKIYLSDDNQSLIFDAGGHSADLGATLTLDDGDANVGLPVRIRIENRKPERIAALELPHFVLGVPGFMFFVDYDDEPVEYRLDDYFSDPEGLPLEYSLDSATKLALLEDGVLKIDPTETSNERLKLTVTDSSGEILTVDLRLIVDSWWTLNLRRVLTAVLIIAALLVLIVIMIRRESNIGYLRVSSAVRGGEELEIIEKRNRRRVRLYSLELSKFIKNRVRGFDGMISADREQGKLTGHLIFGSKVCIKGCTADSIELNGDSIKPAKKLSLKSGDSLTLVYDDIRITITNRN